MLRNKSRLFEDLKEQVQAFSQVSPGLMLQYLLRVSRGDVFSYVVLYIPRKLPFDKTSLNFDMLPFFTPLFLSP